MTITTSPTVQSDGPAASETEPLNLYKVGILFVIRCRYWSSRTGNDPQELELTADRIDARAIE